MFLFQGWPLHDLLNPRNWRDPKTHVIEEQFIVLLTKFDELELK